MFKTLENKNNGNKQEILNDVRYFDTFKSRLQKKRRIATLTLNK